MTTGTTNPYVVVSGPLAAGKTTLVKLLAERLGWDMLLEDLSANPYLADYYNDMRRWGFHTVCSFLIRALHLQDDITKRLAQSPLCQDWYVAEHYDIYGIHTYEEGIIDERDRKAFQQLHEYLMSHCVQPTLLVKLTADPGTLLRRLNIRQREVEKPGIPAEYVQRLVERYRVWSQGLRLPFIEINTTVSDLVHDSAAREAVISKIQAALR